MDLLLCAAIAFLSGVLGSAFWWFFFVRRKAAVDVKTQPRPEVRSAEEQHRPKTSDKRLNELDARLRKLEEHAKQKTADKKFESLTHNVSALERDVRPLQSRLKELETEIIGIRHAHTSASPTPEPEPSAAAVAVAAEPSEAIREIASNPAAKQFETRSPGQIIVESFDDVDAHAMRRIDRMKQEYADRLGPALADLYERDGAYVFVMDDKTAYVHPKPNSPLPRIWERAFLGASSYSRPIQRVHKAALVRQPDGDYEVIEKGDFQVL
jgi:hypothetical protein